MESFYLGLAIGLVAGVFLVLITMMRIYTKCIAAVDVLSAEVCELISAYDNQVNELWYLHDRYSKQSEHNTVSSSVEQSPRKRRHRAGRKHRRGGTRGDTEYLLSSENNKQRLLKSIDQHRNGQTTPMQFDKNGNLVPKEEK